MKGKWHHWRRSTSSWPVWHLMRDGKAICGRNPQGAWKSTPVRELTPWPEASCMSCADLYWGNFPPRSDAAYERWIDSLERDPAGNA